MMVDEFGWWVEYIILEGHEECILKIGGGVFLHVKCLKAVEECTNEGKTTPALIKVSLRLFYIWDPV
jgi:hypothetical protein